MPRIISATKKGKYNTILEELNRGVQIDTTDSEGATPLYWSACRGDVTLTRFLMEKGANVNHAVKWESTPLHAAADRGHEECVECLLNGNADVNARNRNQDTPLHLAAYRGYYQVCLLLLAYNASMTLQNFMGKTPYQEAKEAGHSRIAKILDANTKRGTFPLENKSLSEIYRTKFTTGTGEAHSSFERQMSNPTRPSLKRSGDSSFGEPISLAGATASSPTHRSFPDLNMLSTYSTSANGNPPYTDRYHPAMSRVYYDKISTAPLTNSDYSTELLRQLRESTSPPSDRPVYLQANDRDVYTRIEDLELRLAYAESAKMAADQQNLLLRNENTLLQQRLSSCATELHQSRQCNGGTNDETINQLRDSLTKERVLRVEAESKARQAMKDMFSFRKRCEDLISSAVNSDSDPSTSPERSHSDNSFLNNYEKKGS